MLGTATAPDNLGFNNEDVDIIVEQPRELAIQCVVYVGDILTLRQKQSPNLRLGGKLFPTPDFRTVPNNVVQRCAITRLKKAMRGIHKNHVKEEDQGRWIASYTLKNQWNPVTQVYEDLIIGGPNATKTPGSNAPAASTDLLYKEIRPISEIGMIAGRQNGVIALGEDIQSSDDIKAAQFHYFPNWLEIVAQKVFLPERLRELEDHIRDRQEVTQSSALRGIGEAFLMSCNDFRVWGKDYLDFLTARIKETEKEGGVSYGEIGERLFRVLELTREDKLVQDMAQRSNDSSSAQTMMAEAIKMQAASQQRMDSFLELMVRRGEGSLPAPADPAPIASQPPAPVTIEQAAVEVERAISEDVEIEGQFVDMSEAIVEPVDVEGHVTDVGDDEIDAVTEKE